MPLPAERRDVPVAGNGVVLDQACAAACSTVTANWGGTPGLSAAPGWCETATFHANARMTPIATGRTADARPDPP
jgi:hypothetical protein